jgi:hypothetical protein
LNLKNLTTEKTTMSEPQRPLNTFHAFCSLLLPGLGQLCQKRPGAAFGFFALFFMTALMPAIIVSALFANRFTGQTPQIHIIHVLIFGGVCFPLMLAFFFAVVDAVAWKPGDRTRFKPLLFIVGILFFPLLIAILLPATPAAREAGRRISCANNLKQIGIGFLEYHDAHDRLPPAYTVDDHGKPMHSWRVLILPHMGLKALYDKIRLNEPWDSEYNQQFHSQVPLVYRCPSSSRRGSDPKNDDFQCPTCNQKYVAVPGGCSYSVVVGEKAAFNGSQTREFKDFAEGGISNTILVVERKTPVNWMDPTQEITFETACKGINVGAMGISSFHAGAVNVLIADGAVRGICDDIYGETLWTLLTIDAEVRGKW